MPLSYGTLSHLCASIAHESAADPVGWIECAGVHVARLQADQRVVVQRWQRVGAHPALAVHRHAHHALASQADQRECLEDAHVHFFAHHDGDRRRAE